MTSISMIWDGTNGIIENETADGKLQSAMAEGVGILVAGIEGAKAASVLGTSALVGGGVGLAIGLGVALMVALHAKFDFKFEGFKPQGIVQMEKASEEAKKTIESTIKSVTPEIGSVNIPGSIFNTTTDPFNKAYGASLNTNVVPAYASGGMVEDGLFFANSTEIVGRFSNGRTAVANNAQITAGIERAVYRAMMASKGSGGGKTVIVLDGHEVGRVFGDAIDAERRRSGASLRVEG